ncbi:hypothetical protein V8C42DRAFT_325853 [Trichoderma barbatum]
MSWKRRQLVPMLLCFTWPSVFQTLVELSVTCIGCNASCCPFQQRCASGVAMAATQLSLAEYRRNNIVNPPKHNVVMEAVAVTALFRIQDARQADSFLQGARCDDGTIRRVSSSILGGEQGRKEWGILLLHDQLC